MFPSLSVSQDPGLSDSSVFPSLSVSQDPGLSDSSVFPSLSVSQDPGVPDGRHVPDARPRLRSEDDGAAAARTDVEREYTDDFPSPRPTASEDRGPVQRVSIDVTRGPLY